MRSFLLLFITILSGTLVAQNINGYWEGSLKITPRDSLRLGMFIELIGDSLHIELDSPDQYALGMSAQQVSFRNDTLSWKASSLNASFRGVLIEKTLWVNDHFPDSCRLTTHDRSSIEGTFIQNRQRFPITLTRAERTVLRRPQTPNEPYPYASEDIRFRTRDGKLVLIDGTLTKPESAPPTALYILISGSGWQDRNESLMGHKPFLVIADHLTRTQNAAVFRYDDFPQALFLKSTTLDFADGVQLAMDSLLARPDLAGLPVVLLGHSEGSIVAFIVGSKDPRVSEIITLGGVAQPIHEVLLYQIRAIYETDTVLTPAEIDKTVQLSDQLYRLVRKSKDSKEAARRIGDFWDEQSAKLTPEEQKRYNMTPQGKYTSIQQLTSPWFFTLFHLDPKTYLKKVHCPVVAINGEKDLQVDAVANQQLMRKYLNKSQNHQFHIILNANHLLQTCTTGSPSEYATIEETIGEETLRLLHR